MTDGPLWEELVRDEGLKLESYQDTEELWTIGVGHLLGTERRMTRITPREAQALYAADVADAEAVAIRLFGVIDLDGPRGRALVNMAFNLGPNRLAGFVKFIAAIRRGDWFSAGAEMEASKWWSQVGDRAPRLRHMIETNEVPT